MTEKEFRLDVVARARSYLATNYKLYGRSRAEGVDCGGVAFAVGREIGAFDPAWDVRSYSYATQGEKGIWGPWPGLTRIPQAQKAFADLILLEGAVGSGRPYYCGILGDPHTRSEEYGLGFSIIVTRPSLEVVEIPLNQLLQSRGIFGVVYRFDFPPTAAREDAQPTIDSGDTSPELIS